MQFFQFVIHHWFLWLLFVVVLVAIIVAEIQADLKGGRSASPNQAVNLMNHEQALVLDVRSKELYKAGHVLDAMHMPAADVIKKLDKLTEYQTKPIVVVCAQGIQAQKVARELKAKGFEKVYHLQGGMSAWRSAGLPVSQK